MLLADWLHITCTLSMGIMSGIYFIFSNTIMPALKNDINGANSMAKINDVILNPTFKSIFFLSAIASAYYGFYAAKIDVLYQIGCIVFFVGTFLVTLVRSVPLNKKLKEAVLTGNNTESDWAKYIKTWSFWNHIRTISSVSALIFILISGY